MAKKITKDVNISINSIEKSAVVLLQSQREKKRVLLKSMGEEGIQKVQDYIFGVSEENPFEEITEEYNQKLEALQRKIENTARVEKNNYLGKKKKGVNYIKKIKIEEPKEKL
jgi:hypothetical protein